MRPPLFLPVIAVILLFVPLFAACRSNSQLDEQALEPLETSTPTSTQAAQTPTTLTQPTETPAIDPTPQAMKTETPLPTEAVRDLCDGEDLAEYTEAVPVSETTPAHLSASLFDSWVAFDGITALSWASYWIVQVRIAAECDVSSDLGYPEYIVEVEQTFRGPVQEYIRVTGIGDRFGSQPFPVVGDKLVLFTSDPSEPGNNGMNWVTGGPQGSWYIEDGLVGSVYSALRLTIDEFRLAIAVALKGDPPEYLPVPAVSLQESPINPDLLELDTAYPSGCGGVLLQGAFQGRETIDLLWTSQQVFAGTVVEQLPSFQLAEPSHETDSLLRPIVTDYLVRVEDPIRGISADLIRIRRLGGEVDGCSVTNREGQLLEVGQRALFFVWTLEPNADDPTYYLNGGSDGFWRFDRDGTLLVRDANVNRGATIVPAQQLADGLRLALEGIPVEYEGYGPEPIPLDAAPAGPPVNWPAFEPDPSLEWISYQYPDYGLQLNYPVGWSVLDSADSGTLSLANYPTVGGDWESIPDGGLRIDITPHESPGYFTTTPVTIGRDGYPGTIYFVSGITGDTYHVYITYEVDGQPWEIAGFFKEPIELKNPNTQLYLAIIMSISHNQ